MAKEVLESLLCLRTSPHWQTFHIKYFLLKKLAFFPMQFYWIYHDLLLNNNMMKFLIVDSRSQYINICAILAYVLFFILPCFTALISIDYDYFSYVSKFLSLLNYFLAKCLFKGLSCWRLSWLRYLFLTDVDLLIKKLLVSFKFYCY